MIALVQRVKEARVIVEGSTVGEIEGGLLILLGIHRDDGDRELDWVCRKCANLRVFPDQDGTMNRSALDTGADCLVVSQFTLYGDVGKGNRPSYNRAAPPEDALPVFDRFVHRLEKQLGRSVPTGVFGAMMDVQLVNDGPVTIWIERPPESGAD